jgi:protein arginine N-methyltransferase 1
MYTISQLGNMYTNKARLDAYGAALCRVVTPNSVVLDIGAGTGIFALLACRYGARRVYAVESDNAINLARAFAAANGYSDRLTCIQSVSTRIELPERADVIISDLSGQLPLFERHIPAIIDARDRFLAPGGILIPQKDHLRAAIVEATDDYQKLVQPWSENALGLDLRIGWRLVANICASLTGKQAKYLTRSVTLATLDHRSIVDSNIRRDVIWTVDRPGTGHGAAVWFDRVVADRITISTNPDAPEAVNVASVYGTAFFPWLSPVDLKIGDRIGFRVKADLVVDRYVWRWETIVYARGRRREIKAHFHQSSLGGSPQSLGSLSRREAEYIPAANKDAEIDCFVLSKIDGRTSLFQIAQALAATFPSRFKGLQDALSRVADLAEQYSEHSTVDASDASKSVFNAPVRRGNKR